MEMNPGTNDNSQDAAARALLQNPTRRLACGAVTDDLLEQAADGRAADLTVHQQSCSYCQPALAAFAGIWGPVTLAAASPIPLPPESAATIAAGVLAGIRPANPSAAGPTPTPAKPAHFWLWLVLGAVALATVTTVLLLTQHLTHPTSVTPTTPTVSRNPVTASQNLLSPTPPAATRPSPRTAKPAPKASVAPPTAVPAGNGGQAATTSASARNDQLILLFAGIALIAAGGANLARVRRRRRTKTWG